MNILKFYVVFLNILLVLCSAEENDIEKLHNFLSNYIKGALYDVFVSHYNCNDKIYMNCQDNNITSLNIRLNNDENLNFNNFNDFPSFHSLKTIKIFNINFNNQEFPSRLLNSQNYPELTQLIIRNSVIKNIPSNFSSDANSKISTIEIVNGSLTEVPYQFSSLVNLKQLILSKNEITELTEEIHKFKNIETLDISNNNLKKVPDDMMKGMNNLNNLNLSNNIQLKMSVINFKESGYIENCNFENTKIACYEKNTCANIVPELNNYKECSSELINKLRPNNKNRILTIFSIVSVILLCIVGFIWMYKVNKKSKKSREADIIISPTVKNENYYKDSLSNKKNAEENKTNQSFNVGNDTQTIIDNSFTSHKEAVSSLTSNSISNIQRNLSNNSNGSFIINNAVQSPILVGNDPSLVHPLRNLTLQASNNNNGNQMISSSTTPMASSSTINNQTIATSMEMQSPFTNSGFNNNITSINVTNPMFKGNETNILQIPSSTYINPNMPNNIMNGQTLINLYPINMLNYSMNNSYLAGSSSSDNIIPTTDGKDIKEFDDKLKKKILKEKMNLEKFSINQNNNQNDPNNNLPPYSEL